MQNTSSDIVISHSISTNAMAQFSLVDEDNAKIAKDDQKLSPPSFWKLLALNLPEWKQACLGCLNATLFGAIEPLYAFAMGSMISIFFPVFLSNFLWYDFVV